MNDMKKTIAIVLMAIATSVFGSQQTQADEARARHIAEVQRDRARHIAELQRAEAEKKILEMERQEIEMLERNKRIRDIVEAEIAKMLERAHPSSQSLEVALAEERARRKARLAAKEAETNKRLVKKLTKESAGLMRKNEQLRKELDKTINELAEYRSQAKHLSSQLRSLPKSLGRGASSGPARRRK